MNDCYVGDVFVVVEIGVACGSSPAPSVVAVYSNQYSADQYAYDFNEKAKAAGIPHRYAVICRSLYE